MNNDTFDICSKTGVGKNMPGNRHKNGRKTRKEESETETDSAGSSPRRPASSITSVTSRSSRSTSIYGKDSDDVTSSYSARSEDRASKSRIYQSKQNSKHSNLRSGMYDKPNDNIVRKMRWAHRALDYAYWARNIEFNKLTCGWRIKNNSHN